MSKQIIQQVWDTPKGFLLITAKTQPTHEQVHIVDLHWQGFTAEDICFLMNRPTHFVENTIQEFAL